MMSVAGSIDASRHISVYCIPLSGNIRAVREVLGFYNGKYYVTLIPPGDYRILAIEKPPQLEYRNPAVLRAYDSKGQTIHVASGQKTQVTVELIKSE